MKGKANELSFNSAEAIREALSASLQRTPGYLWRAIISKKDMLNPCTEDSSLDNQYLVIRVTTWLAHFGCTLRQAKLFGYYVLLQLITVSDNLGLNFLSCVVLYHLGNLMI